MIGNPKWVLINYRYDNTPKRKKTRIKKVVKSGN